MMLKEDSEVLVGNDRYYCFYYRCITITKEKNNKYFLTLDPKSFMSLSFFVLFKSDSLFMYIFKATYVVMKNKFSSLLAS